MVRGIFSSKSYERQKIMKYREGSSESRHAARKRNYLKAMQFIEKSATARAIYREAYSH